VAVVAVGQPWTEFGVIKGEALAFSRSLSTGPALAGEIKRSVAVYGGQSAQNPVRAVYAAGTTEQAELRDRLQHMLGIPVFPFDPFDGAEGPDLPADHRGDFAGAIGLLYGYSGRQALPINFVQPKQPKPPRDPNKRKLALAAAVMGVLLLGGIGYGAWTLHKLGNDLQEVLDQKAEVEQVLARYDNDVKRIKAMDEWSDNEIVWLDELYDLTERFPDTASIRLTSLKAQPKTKTAKDKDVAHVTLTGVVVSDYVKVLMALQRKLEDESHYRVEGYTTTPNRGADRIRFRSQFTTPLNIAKRQPNEYTVRLPEPTEPQRPGGRPSFPRPGGRMRLPGNIPQDLIGDIFGEDVP
jgi:hypothetical protein